jgi:hypothetical protein
LNSRKSRSKIAAMRSISVEQCVAPPYRSGPLLQEQNPAEEPQHDWVPQTDAEKRLILRELENILRHPLFLSSKRYPGFLQYVVEETLNGRGEQLKEHTIGVEVFGRKPNYECSQDNVVRATAAETRRRLTQYYESLNELSEVRLALLVGSYLPRFYRRSSVTEMPSPSRPFWTHTRIALLLVLALGLAGALGWRVLPHPDRPIDLFWRPFDNWNGPVLLCLGLGENREARFSLMQSINFDLPAPPRVQHPEDPYIRLHSAVDLVRFAMFLESRDKATRIADESCSFAELRSGPAILIGNNQWAIRLTAPLRFSIKREPATQERWISDRQNPSRKDWVSNLADANIAKDYALISRFLEPTTGQWIMVASGLRRFGTTACAELLCNGMQMQSLAEKFPPGWDKLNLQLILETDVVQTYHSRPRIIESHFWRPSI